MPSQPEAQGDILKEFREGTFLSSLDKATRRIDTCALPALASRYRFRRTSRGGANHETIGNR